MLIYTHSHIRVYKSRILLFFIVSKKVLASNINAGNLKETSVIAVTHPKFVGMPEYDIEDPFSLLLQASSHRDFMAQRILHTFYLIECCP